LTGVGIPNPIESADNNHITSSVCTAVLADSLLNDTLLTIADHQKVVRGKKSIAQASNKANAAIS